MASQSRMKMSIWSRLARDLPDNCSSFYVAVKPSERRTTSLSIRYDAALVGAMRGVPTLNGYSGYLPPGWDLWEVKDAGFESNVQRWIAAPINSRAMFVASL